MKTHFDQLLKISVMILRKLIFLRFFKKNYWFFPSCQKKKTIFAIIISIILYIYGCSLLSVRAEEVKTIPIDNFYDTSETIVISFSKKEFLHLSKSIKEQTGLVLKPSYSNPKEDITAVLINKNDLDKLTNFTNHYKVLKNPPFRYLVPNYNTVYKKKFKNLDDLFLSYKSYQLNEKLLKALAREYPDLVTYRELGKTTLGFPIPSIRITRYNNKKNKVSVLFNGAHHSNELISTEHCYDIISELLSNPKSYSDILDNINIWVVPIVNPDGSYLFWYKHLSMGRKNGFLHESHSQMDINRGIDLNRNYPFKWNSGHPRASSADPSHSFYRGEKSASEPETKAMIELAETEKFLFSISFHSFATKLLFPYTIEGVKNPSIDYPQVLARKLVKLAKSYHPIKQYEAVKNIYPVDGTDQDFYYNEYGTIALLAESSHKNIEYSKIKYVLEGFRPVWQAMLKECLEGYKISIKVLDPEGDPLEANILTDDINYYESEKNNSDPETGIFRRMVLHPSDSKKKEYKIKIVHPAFQEENLIISPSTKFDPIEVIMKPLSIQ